MDIKVSEDAQSSDKFRKLAKRISKYVDFRGCRTEECIKNRMKSKNSKYLNNLVNYDFALHLFLEARLSPHRDYQKILGMDNEQYNNLIMEKNEESSNDLSIILEYEKHLKSERLKKKKKAR